MYARPAPPPTLSGNADPRHDIAGERPMRTRPSSATEVEGQPVMTTRPGLPQTMFDGADPRNGMGAEMQMRSRTSSAPERMTAEPMQVEPTIRSRSSRAVPNGSAMVPDIEADLSSLMEQLANNFSISPTDGHGFATRELPNTLESVNELLVTTIQSELAVARHALGEGRILEAVNGALLLLHAADAPVRNEAFPEIARFFRRCAASDSTVQCAISLIQSTASDARHPEGEHAIALAQHTLLILNEATHHFPFDARCEIAIAALRTAADIASVTIARTVIDGLLGGYPENDPEAAAKRITTFAGALPQIPIEYRLLAAMKLYQNSPPAAPWCLRSLEAIASETDSLPDAPTTTEFCKTLNQDIYLMRMANE